MAGLMTKLLSQIRELGLSTWLLILAVSLLALVVYEGVFLFRLSTTNRLIVAGVPAEYDDNQDPQIVLAKAWQLQINGRHQQALQTYNSIEAGNDPKILEIAKYNSGTILLENAAKKWNELGVFAFAEVDTLVNLAEENFREVLRLNPYNQDARYNLEYTLRIRPPRKEVEKSDWDGQKSSVFSILPGIPRGGP